MAGPVICDAGPLIALAGVGRLELLERLFGEVWLPPAVKEECLAGEGDDRALILAALEAGWLRLRSMEEKAAPISPSLGAGETEAIWLAQCHTHSLFIVDDRLARRQALSRGIAIVGTARLLWTAEQRGEISDAAEVISEMAENGYRISLEVLHRIQMMDQGRQ